MSFISILLPHVLKINLRDLFEPHFCGSDGNKVFSGQVVKAEITSPDPQDPHILIKVKVQEILQDSKKRTLGVKVRDMRGLGEVSITIHPSQISSLTESDQLNFSEIPADYARKNIIFATTGILSKNN